MQLTNSRGRGCAPCVALLPGKRKQVSQEAVPGCRGPESRARPLWDSLLLSAFTVTRHTSPASADWEDGCPGDSAMLPRGWRACESNPARPVLSSCECGRKAPRFRQLWEKRMLVDGGFECHVGGLGWHRRPPQARSQQNSVLPRGGEVTMTPEPQLCHRAVRREVTRELQALPPSFCPWSQGPASRLPVHTPPGVLLSVGPHAALPGLGASNSSFR